ncbi:MAG TPA: hypothetical protein VGB53_13545 [Rubricoccaceae bacterium]
MIARAPHQDSDEAWHDAFVARRRGARRLTLESARGTIIAAYSDYRAGDLATLPPDSASLPLAEALRFCYEEDRSSVGARLFSDLVNVEARCAYCGIGDAEQLDHYLPKGNHPTYAICASNLVPACGTCNGSAHKGTRVLDAAGRRLILHPYRDAIPDALYAVVAVRDGAIVPSYGVRPGAEHMQRHFETLELATRYLRKASQQIGRTRRIWKQASRTMGSEAFRADLLRDARALAARNGPNHWEAVLFDGLARCEDVCHGRFPD